MMRKALRPVRNRLRTRHLVWGLQIGLLLCLASALCVVIASFLTPMEHLWQNLTPCAAFPLLGALTGVLWPIRTARAARAADASGLKERAVTALWLQGEKTPMAILQREDALACLQAHPARASIPVRAIRRLWLPMCLCAIALSVLFLVPNPQHDILRAREQARQELRAQADEIEQAAETLAGEDLTEEEERELRRITGEMARELREAQDNRDALEKLDSRQREMEKLQKEIRQRTANELAEAMAKQPSLQNLSKALEGGDSNEMAEALESIAEAMENAQQQKELSEALQSLAESLTGSAGQQAISASAAAAKAGNTSLSIQQLALALQSASGGAGTTAANLTALMRVARMGAAQAGAQGLGAAGSGTGMGSGGGAGRGSTNKDAGYTEGFSQSNQGIGLRSPEEKVSAYERIYDPLRIGDGGEISYVEGAQGEGETQQIDVGPGMGDLSGSVPYNQVIGEYQQSAAQAMRRSALPETLQDWVQRYFNALIE